MICWIFLQYLFSKAIQRKQNIFYSLLQALFLKSYAQEGDKNKDKNNKDKADDSR